MAPQLPANSRPVNTVLMASAFQMSGDYADHVAITLDANGNLLYYPAPTDLSDSSTPIEIGDGWWLNRQGISANSQFTSYTFDEYMALKTPPTRRQLIESIIPGARVTAFRTLDIPASQAASRLPEIRTLLTE